MTNLNDATFLLLVCRQNLFGYQEFVTQIGNCYSYLPIDSIVFKVFVFNIIHWIVLNIIIPLTTCDDSAVWAVSARWFRRFCWFSNLSDQSYALNKRHVDGAKLRECHIFKWGYFLNLNDHFKTYSYLVIFCRF